MTVYEKLDKQLCMMRAKVAMYNGFNELDRALFWDEKAAELVNRIDAMEIEEGAREWK